jgi:hypothetical protein
MKWHGIVLCAAFSTMTQVGMAFETELQWTVCEPNAEAVLEKMGQEADTDSEEKNLSFLEMEDLRYQGLGVTFRVIQNGEKAKTTVKVKFAGPDEVNWQALNEVDHKCEWDHYSSSRKFTCNLNQKNSGRPVFTALQLKALRGLTGLEITAQELEEIPVWGRVGLEIWDLANDSAWPLTFEIVRASDGFSLMELSSRVDEKDEGKALAEIGSEIRKRGLVLCAKQGGRTRELLMHLTGQ